jgi:hypothetical protein
MDLLAAIAADPTLLPLWAVVAFAAGMYPVGMLFQCSPCCNTCSACEEGTLPETITVTLDGFSDKSQGPDLCILKFDACYGSGAAGKVTAPGGDPDTAKGPITAVSLANGGSGYALLGRVQPTLTATGSGDGATFTVTVEASEDDCGVDFWKVSKVTASGGTGYTDGEQLTITVAEGDTTEEDATVTIKTTRSEPTLAVTVDSYGGSGADLAVVTSSNTGTPATWAAASVTVNSGGTGYTDGEGVTITGETDRDLTVGAATGYIRTGRIEPTVDVSVASNSGSGAVLSATLTTGTSSAGRPVWIVDAVTITDGGAGYEVGDSVYVTVTDGTEEWSSWFEATVDAVDASGAIESVTVTSGGEYYKDSREIEEVVLEVYGTYFGGSYYHDDGVAENATVASGGIYYREDAEQPPYVADITVTIDQTAPSAGAGAEITAAVEDDPDSPNFGKVVGLTIDNGGDDYLAWEWLPNDCCGWQLNDRPIVLQRDNEGSGGCKYVHRFCGGWRGRTEVLAAVVEYRGPAMPPIVSIVRSSVSAFGSAPSDGTAACLVTLTAEDSVTNCSDFSFSAAHVNGISATVTAGGEYDPGYRGRHGSTGAPLATCTPCCQGGASVPQEIEVTLDDSGGFWNGNYVLPVPGAGPTAVTTWLLNVEKSGPEYEGLPWWLIPRILLRVDIEQGVCPDISSYGCKNCVKKCEVRGSIVEGYSSFFLDRVYCPLYDFGLTETQRYSSFCANACFDVPLCALPDGFEMRFINGYTGSASAACSEADRFVMAVV